MAEARIRFTLITGQPLEVRITRDTEDPDLVGVDTQRALELFHEALYDVVAANAWASRNDPTYAALLSTVDDAETLPDDD